jgi:UDP-N-acetylglucosamine 4-epimerase
MSTYAAVIPKWIDLIINNKEVFINGDGKTSRDFCFIDNAVQANILAATTSNQFAMNNIYNVAVGDRTSLNQLYEILRLDIKKKIKLDHTRLTYRDFREGDVRHSQADILKANEFLGYKPSHSITKGLKETVNWHLNKNK